MCPQVVDVGGGTGFCTLGIVQTVKPENVTMCDQSPHQLAKAKAKPALKGVTILEVGPGHDWGCGLGLREGIWHSTIRSSVQPGPQGKAYGLSRGSPF